MALTRLARTGDIVVAMTDPPLISLVAAAVAWCKGARLINWLQDIFPEVASRLGVNPLPPLLDRGLRRLRDASLRAAEMNVVLGSHMMEFVCARGVPRSRCRVIANWADAEAVQPRPAAQSALRRRLQLAGKFVVGYSGNLGRAHEYETVLGAAEVMRADIDTAFLFGGGGIKMQALRTEVRQRHLQNFVFLPYQARQELGDSLAAADVHLASLIPALEGVIVPSKFYGILAAGRPAVFVGDPDGELARIIDAARCGVVVPVGDVSRLVEALRGLRADAARRRAMGSAARLLALSRYSSHRAIESWVTLLDEFHVATVSESCEDGRLKR
jgi:glycosyltransferase involved in cell wall biosynthesis